jgi:hypothetical protein
MSKGEPRVTMAGLRDLIIEVGHKVETQGSVLNQVKEMAEENNRTLRGSNGNQGLVSEVHVLAQSMENCLAALNCQVDGRDGNSGTGKDEDNKPLTFRYLFDKLAVPVVVAVSTWLLVDILPQIIAHLSAAGAKIP